MALLPNFKNKSLLEQAFIHRSYLNELRGKKNVKSLDSNERLEFLGDSVIALLTSEFLYKKFSNLAEGKLTNLRSFLVKTQTLSKVARELSLGQYLKLSRGEQNAGPDNPTLLANTFEAVVGAIFLDGGLKTAKTFLTQVLFPKIHEGIDTYYIYKDNKSLLQETIQKDKKATPIYKVLASEGPDHKRIFTVGVFVERRLLGKGRGISKQEAEQAAAAAALQNLE